MAFAGLVRDGDIDARWLISDDHAWDTCKCGNDINAGCLRGVNTDGQRDRLGVVIGCWRDSRRDLVSLLVPFHSKYIVNDLDGLFVFASGELER